MRRITEITSCRKADLCCIFLSWNVFPRILFSQNRRALPKFQPELMDAEIDCPRNKRHCDCPDMVITMLPGASHKGFSDISVLWCPGCAREEVALAYLIGVSRLAGRGRYGRLAAACLSTDQYAQRRGDGAAVRSLMLMWRCLDMGIKSTSTPPLNRTDVCPLPT